MDEKIRAFVGFLLSAVVSKAIAVFVDDMKAGVPLASAQPANPGELI